MSFAFVLYEIARTVAKIDSAIMFTGDDDEGVFGLQIVAEREGEEAETIAYLTEHATPEEIEEVRTILTELAAEEETVRNEEESNLERMRTVLLKLSPEDRITINMPLPEDIEALVNQAEAEHTPDAKPSSTE